MFFAIDKTRTSRYYFVRGHSVSWCRLGMAHNTL